jgi:hypothetical protein
MRAAARLAATVLAAQALACSGTRLVEVQVAADPGTAPSRRLLVVAVGEDPQVREAFERAFARALSERGLDVVPGVERLTPATEIGSRVLEEGIRVGGIDAVLATRLVGDRIDEEWVAGSSQPVPDARGLGGHHPDSWAPHWDPAWDPFWEQAGEPGRAVTVRVVQLETRLYHATSGRVLWTGRSESRDPGSPEDLMSELAHVVARSLCRAGLLP